MPHQCHQVHGNEAKIALVECPLHVPVSLFFGHAPGLNSDQGPVLAPGIDAVSEWYMLGPGRLRLLAFTGLRVGVPQHRAICSAGAQRQAGQGHPLATHKNAGQVWLKQFPRFNNGCLVA